MQKTGFSWSRFDKMPLIGIMRNIAPSDMNEILPLFYSSGLTTIEITMNSPGFEEGISTAAKTFGDRLNIGAGTVCSEDDLEIALGLGAQFIVTPVVDARIIAACRQSKIPVFAGAYTPTEILLAWNLGADIVKLFPAVGNGIDYLKAVKGPFPQIKLLPTGGVSLDNCKDFMQAGATGLGIGSELFPRQLVRDKDWTGLVRHFVAFQRCLKDNERV